MSVHSARAPRGEGGPHATLSWVPAARGLFGGVRAGGGPPWGSRPPGTWGGGGGYAAPTLAAGRWTTTRGSATTSSTRELPLPRRAEDRPVGSADPDGDRRRRTPALGRLGRGRGWAPDVPLPDGRVRPGADSRCGGGPGSRLRSVRRDGSGGRLSWSGDTLRSSRCALTRGLPPSTSRSASTRPAAWTTRWRRCGARCSPSWSASAWSGLGRLRIGGVAYRDQGDAYVTQPFDFTDDPGEAQRTPARRPAGGGDGPEAVHEALDSP